jgi:hypothetical protein
VSFDVSPGAYLRFMGRYSEPLAARFADLPPARQAALRERCRHLLPPGTIEITAAAWAASGHA